MTAPPESGETVREETGNGARRWRPTISVVLIFGFGLLVLVAVSSVLLISLGTAQKNTLALLRQTADFSVTGLIDRIDIHLGAARDQSVFLAEMVVDGELDATDPDQLADAMLGALAATPQVTGMGYFSAAGWSLRVGRESGEVLRIYNQEEPRPEIRRLVRETSRDARPRWGGVFWVADLKQPHLAVTVPVTQGGVLLGVMSSVVSVRALSHFVDDYALQTGMHPFILYGSDRVLAHPRLIDGHAGLGPDKPLPNLADVGDPMLAEIWNPDKQPLELLEDSGSSLLGHYRRLPDDQVYYVYRVVGGFGPKQLYMGVYARDSEIDSSETDRVILAGWIGFAILVLSLLVAVVLGRAIARPVRDLAGAARAISTFDFRRVPQAKGSAFRELDSASRAFNSMLAGLRWFETYVPRSLVLRLIQRGESAVESEERQVTVIFTDIVGFTAASQQLTPRETADLVNHHFGLLAAEIERTGGTLDKYIGDSVMAFWGAPDDQPDHAERACRAALAITAALERDNRERAARGAPAVRIRLGIHSGPVIVGNIGAPGRVNYTLIGDSVNLANRLEAFGKEVAPDAATAIVLLSAETREQLGPAWQVEDLGARQMRGRAGKTRVYRLLGLSS